MLYPDTVEVLASHDNATEFACATAAVKFSPVTFAALIVAFWLAGLNE